LGALRGALFYEERIRKNMEKTLTIGGKDVRLSNNLVWAMIYRDQFGRDIVPALTPLLAAVLDVVSGFVQESGGTITAADALKALNGDTLIDAVAHLSGFESVEIINVTWAMAKACNDDLPEPERWIRGFDSFPLDVVVPEVFSLAFQGMVSEKNLRRLKSLLKSVKAKQTIRPLNSKKSSSQEQNED